MFKAIYDASEALHRPVFYVRDGKIEDGKLSYSNDSPERAATILTSFRAAGIPVQPAAEFAPEALTAVHTTRYVEFLRGAYGRMAKREGVETELVATMMRDPRAMHYPQSLAGQMAWHMSDVFSPIGRHTWTAAIGAVNAALTAAQCVRSGDRAAYALTRPPGHHAAAEVGGGFCYFNNAAVAADYLAAGGKRVAVLDVDADHGNGTQDIFYRRGDVLHVSLHATPLASFPFFVGFAEERGEGAGLGYNLNLPLELGTGNAAYLEALARGLDAIARFDPHYLVVALGVDGHRDEPSQLFDLTTDGFLRIGEAIAALGLPTVFTQEGGYNLRNLATNLQAVMAPFISSGVPERAAV